MIGAAATSGSGGDNITHFAGIRLRLTGEGDMHCAFYGLDDVESQTLVDIPMASTSRVSPLRLANFTNQVGALELNIDGLDDNFRCNRIIIYAKTLWIAIPA